MALSLKLLLVGLLAVAVGGLWSANEIRMRLSGRKTTAVIVPASEDSSGRARADVSYVFADEDGSDRSGSFFADSNWQPPEDRKIEVVYLPGRPETVRLAGEKSSAGFIVFVCGVAVTGLGIWFFRHESLVQKGDRMVKKDPEDGKSDMFGKLAVPQARGKKPK